MKNQKPSKTESLGQILGHLHTLGISVIGIGLIGFGIALGISVFNAESPNYSGGFPLTGSGIVAGAALVAGAILQASKSRR